MMRLGLFIASKCDTAVSKSTVLLNRNSFGLFIHYFFIEIVYGVLLDFTQKNRYSRLLSLNHVKLSQD